MHIKIKIRTLVISALALAIVAYMALPMYLMHVKKYDAIVRYFPYSTQAPQALLFEAQGEDPSPQGTSMIYILPDSMGMTGAIETDSQIRDALHKYNQIIKKYPKSQFVEQAMWGAAQTEVQLGNLPEALRIYEEISRTKGTNATEAQQQVEQLQNRIAPSTRSSNRVLSITGQVLAGSRPMKNVYVFLRSTLQKNSLEVPPQNRYQGGYTDVHGVFRIYDVPAGDYQVGVGLSPTQISGYYLPTHSNATVQIKDGSVATYSIGFVPQVTVISPVGGVTLQGHSGVTFRWNPYPGAVSYKLTVASISKVGHAVSTIQASLPGTYRETTASFSFKSLRQLLPGSVKDSVHGLNPGSVLGAVYPGGEFSWSVDAYDRRGALLSSSRGYYLADPQVGVKTPLFYTPTTGQLAGDVYLLQFKSQEAIAAYQKEENSPYALRALGIMALYGIGWNDKGNPQKALSYFERIPHPSADLMALIDTTKRELLSTAGSQH